MRWLAAVTLAAAVIGASGAGCSKSEPAGSAAAGSAGPAGPPQLVSGAELARGKDACAAYVDAACACAKTVPAMGSACELAKSEPEALRISLEVAQSPQSSRKDALDAQRNIRKVVKACIEDAAKLPAAGCPAAR